MRLTSWRVVLFQHRIPAVGQGTVGHCDEIELFRDGLGMRRGFGRLRARALHARCGEDGAIEAINAAERCDSMLYYSRDIWHARRRCMLRGDGWRSVRQKGEGARMCEIGFAEAERWGQHSLGKSTRQVCPSRGWCMNREKACLMKSRQSMTTR